MKQLLMMTMLLAGSYAVNAQSITVTNYTSCDMSIGLFTESKDINGDCVGRGVTNAITINAGGSYYIDHGVISTGVGWYWDPNTSGTDPWEFSAAQVNEVCDAHVAPPPSPCPNPYAVRVQDGTYCTTPPWGVPLNASDCFYYTSSSCGCPAGTVVNVTISVSGGSSTLTLN